MNDPKVSIITPSFNQGKYLEETILSVLSQTYSNIEYIIIDGGSSDNSVEIIKMYSNKINYWISEKDFGQADAINKGFKKSTGDYLCWVNSDDILYPDFVENRVKQFEKHTDVDMIYGDVEQGWSFDNKVVRKGKQQKWKEMISTCRVNVPQMSAMWKRDVYLHIGGLDISYNVLLDWEYFVRISKNFKILYMPGSHAFFRQHDDSKSIIYNEQWAKELIKYYDLNVFSNNSLTDINIVRQNLLLFCSELMNSTNFIVDHRKYRNEAKKINKARFYSIETIKFLKESLIRLKKLKKL